MTHPISRRTHRPILWWTALCLSGLSSGPLSGLEAKEPPKSQAPTAGAQALRKSAGGNPGVVEIVSERLGETEFRIADEIASAVASTQESGPNGEYALRVTPVVSRGGRQAVRDVLTLPNADLGIASIRILDRLRESGEFGNISDRITYIAPLYVEEVHLVARSNVRELVDLDGQAVSIGEDESTTQLVAREVLSSAGVRIRAEHMDLRESVAALKAGTIAAAFFVSGKPVDGLLTLPRSAGLRLLPVPLPSVPSGFVPSTLSAEDYPELLRPGERVDTLGLQNVLFAYNWPAKSSRAQLGQLLLNSLFSRLEKLQSPPHHPKWQEVNLAANLPNWRRLAAMEAWLRKSGPPQEERSLQAEFNRFLTQVGPRANTVDRETLFRDFQQWWRDNPSTTGSR